VRRIIILEGKEKALRAKMKRVALIKSLIYLRVEDALGGARYKRSIRVDHFES